MKGSFRPKNPKKYKGNPTNIIYRSSWEFKYMLRLDNDPNVLKWSSEETIIPYVSPIDKKVHRYFVDFYVERINNGVPSVELIEIKPKKQTMEPVKKNQKKKTYITEVMTYGVNDAKWKAARQYCVKKGWKFIILTEKELGII